MTKLIKAGAWPVVSLVRVINKVVPHNTHTGTVITSVTVIIVGSYIAAVPQTVVPHFLWDTMAWFIHGLGAAPLIDKVMNKRNEG